MRRFHTLVGISEEEQTKGKVGFTYIFFGRESFINRFVLYIDRYSHDMYSLSYGSPRRRINNEFKI